ncbi:hypothetical protein B0H14DRAFT_3463753 [Mycena olivaceomarginata]|nr:hypothetical protein B0H14DRAFT_3463753 [Mycena olivaceomarginata]
MTWRPKTGDELLRIVGSDIAYAEETYGVEVIAVCTDDGPEGKKMRRLVKEQSSWIAAFECWAHQAHLITGNYLAITAVWMQAAKQAIEIIKSPLRAGNAHPGPSFGASPALTEAFTDLKVGAAPSAWILQQAQELICLSLAFYNSEGQERKQRKRQRKAELDAASATGSTEFFIPSPDEDTEMPLAPEQPELPPREQTPPPDTSAGRPVRAKRLTWKLLQQLPPPPPQFEETTPSEPDLDDVLSPVQPSEYTWEGVKTAKDSFGLFCEYPTIPTHDPERTLSLSDQSNIPVPARNAGAVPDNSRLSPMSAPPAIAVQSPTIPSFCPFRNSTVLGFMNWMWSGSVMKSIAECTRLIDFLKSDAFNKEDLKGFDFKAETAKFDESLAGDIGETLGEASRARRLSS